MPTTKPTPDLVQAADDFARKYEDVFGDEDPQDIINELRGVPTCELLAIAIARRDELNVFIKDEEWPRSVEGVVQALAYLHGRATESGAGASMNLLPIPTAIYWLRELKQQTAAKDAELERLRATMAKDDALLGKVAKSREATERERDSLREANARLAADLDAALKAGKEGQK